MPFFSFKRIVAILLFLLTSQAYCQYEPGKLYVVVKQQTDAGLIDNYGTKVKAHDNSEVQSVILKNLYILTCSGDRDSTMRRMIADSLFMIVEGIPIPEPLYVTPPDDPEYTARQVLDAMSAYQIDMEGGWALMNNSHPVIDVAVLDTRIDGVHPDLDCVGPNCRMTSADGIVFNNHGTAVAGIIGAITNNTEGIAGIGYNHVRM